MLPARASYTSPCLALRAHLLPLAARGGFRVTLNLPGDQGSTPAGILFREADFLHKTGGSQQHIKTKKGGLVSKTCRQDLPFFTHEQTNAFARRIASLGRFYTLLVVKRKPGWKNRPPKWCVFSFYHPCDKCCTAPASCAADAVNPSNIFLR